MNPKHIEVGCPRHFNEVLLRSPTQQLSLNTDLRVSTGLNLKKHWHSRITSFDEFHEFTDEFQQSRGLKWTHRHIFSKVSDTTRVIDELEFRFGYWLMGRLIEQLVYPKVEQIFCFREKKSSRFQRTRLKKAAFHFSLHSMHPNMSSESEEHCQYRNFQLHFISAHNQFR